MVAAAAALAACGSAKHAASFAAPTVLTPARAAPAFALRDASGATVRLSQFRGKAVLLTFIYTRCPDVCPLIAGKLHAALERLGPRAGSARLLAISVDPRGDTPRAVRAFLARQDLTGRMTYLIGSRAQLAPVWRAYGVGVNGTPESREVDHSALVFGISATGQQVTLYPPSFLAGWVVHDVPLLAER